MNFKEWLITELFDNFVKSNGVTLYHYSKVDRDNLQLDPKQFSTNHWTKNDFKASPLPRIFFYLNPEDKEDYFINYFEYEVTVPVNKIYNLIKDPLNFKEEIRNKNYGILNIDEYLQVVSNKFDGAYYNPGFPVVVWFKPIQVFSTNSIRKAI